MNDEAVIFSVPLTERQHAILESMSQDEQDVFKQIVLRRLTEVLSASPSAEYLCT